MKKCYAISQIYNPISRVFNVFILVATVKASYDFPTYTHPVYTNQLCYKCPPGYKKINDCPPGNDASIPAWPRCAKCGTNEYMDDWNINPRCKSQIKCGPTQLPCGKTSTVYKAECTCHSSSIENERGDCVKGVAKSEYDQELDVKNEKIKQCEQTLSNLQRSFPSAAHSRPIPERTSAVSTETICQPWSDKLAILTAVVVVFAIVLLISFLTNLYFCCKYYCKKIKQAMSMRPHENGAGDRLPPDQIEEITTGTEHEGRNQPRKANLDPDASPDESGERNQLLPRDADDNTESDDLDKALYILEKTVRSKDDLDDLMRDVFGFTSDWCEDIKKNPEDLRSKLRQAFFLWKRKKGDGATREALVCALGDQNWNDEADKIAKKLNIPRVKVETGDADTGLDIGIRKCEEMITSGVPAFIRKCLGIQKIDFSIKPSADLIRRAFTLWKRKNSSKATVHFLVVQLLLNEYTDVADKICEELKKGNVDGGTSESYSADAAGDQLNEKAFSSNITENPSEDDKAQPMYSPGSQPPDEPVRELTQPTADVMPSSDINISYSTTASPAENKDDPRTVPKVPYGFDGQPVTYDKCDDDDPAVLKVDDNYGREVTDIDVVYEPAAGGGKSANQTQVEQP